MAQLGNDIADPYKNSYEKFFDQNERNMDQYILIQNKG